jgi:hypothetical protein
MAKGPAIVTYQIRKSTTRSTFHVSVSMNAAVKYRTVPSTSFPASLTTLRDVGSSFRVFILNYGNFQDADPSTTYFHFSHSSGDEKLRVTSYRGRVRRSEINGYQHDYFCRGGISKMPAYKYALTPFNDIFFFLLVTLEQWCANNSDHPLQISKDFIVPPPPFLNLYVNKEQIFFKFFILKICISAFFFKCV